MEVGIASIRAVLPQLTKMLADEYKLHEGAKEGVRYIRRELESMRAALEKVSKVPADQLDTQDKLWARDLRKICYRMEDSLESYMVHVDADGEPESSNTCCISIFYEIMHACCIKIKSLLPWTYKARRDIATEIECIKKEVEEVSKRRVRYRVEDIGAPEPFQYDLRLPARYKDQAKLVGIDRSSKEIIELLSMKGEGTSEQKLKLVSIVGAGGMGKTTLAKVVREKLEEKFDCTAFISVSLKPNLKDILSTILRKVTVNKDVQETKDKSIHRRESQHNYENVGTLFEDEVIDKIRLVLKERRYLIVIDDIWDTQAWELIKCVLVENKLGSKVITTTRNADVANLCCSDEFDGIIHEMQPLTDVDSEQLLYSKVFGKKGCPTELRRISCKILERCKGWPLAIIAIASLLATKPRQTEDQWQSVYKSISTGLGNNEVMKDMRSILSLSYRDMPSHLKACLLYLSIFPEDRIIGRDDLIQRWVAEGFVHETKDEKTLYELGEKYFTDLINRSMIQPTHVDVLGRTQACHVHDIVLDFITSLSAEEDFVTILNGQQHFPPQPDSIHRLSLRNSRGEHGIPQTTKRLPHVRTLVVSSHAINSMPSLDVFPVLRVLDLDHCTSHNIQGLENLVHLRYLKLRNVFYYYDVYIKLPEEIGNLQLLQTLDLKEASVKELPSTMAQLRQLTVLEISLHRCETYESCLLQCFCNMKKLETVYIYARDLNLDFMLQVDWTPSHLRRFTACIRRQTEHILRPWSVWAELSPFSTLPRWINPSLSRLSELCIMVRKLVQRDVEILSDLPVLFTLDLEVVEATEGRLVIAGCAKAFRDLGNLKFASRAVGLVFTPGAMRKLHKLYICFDIAETKDIHGDFNLGLENLTCLKAVHVEIDCRCARLREVEAAEAVVQNATKLNPNHPTLDVKRYFQGEMLREEEIPEELGAMKNEDTQLTRIGPWGGNGGRARDIRVAPVRLETVTIRRGSAVDSLAFSYGDHNGQQHRAGPWGGPYGSVSTIPLGPSEYLTKVSGTVGSCFGVPNMIRSLTFFTNAASYGPFGEEEGDPFVVQAPSNSSIVGFFGRAGLSVDAIGFYVRPLPISTEEMLASTRAHDKRYAGGGLSEKLPTFTR